MGSEIERKFVLAGMPPEAADGEPVEIEQGYLAVTDEVEVRVRRAGGERHLTVKRGRGEEREEIEVGLAEAAFEALWALTEGRRVRKTRYRVELGGGLVAEVDRYAGDHAGLVVAEVEFPSLEADRAFRPPGWLGREVTGDPAYANQSLAAGGHGLDRGGGRRETEDSVYSEGDKRKAGGAYRLESEEPAAEGLRRIATGRARKARKKLGQVEEDGAAAIHGARKDLKKLRSVLRLVREQLGEKAYGAQNRRYRDAGRLLSDTRDAEVKVETLDDLEERFGDEFPTAAVEPWRRDLERERYAAAAEPEVGEQVERASTAIAAGHEEIDGWELEGDSFDLVEPGLLKAYHAGREGLKLVRKDPSNENVHQWRKRTKDLWYQLRILRQLWPEVLGETADQAHDLADLLGDHHDLAVLAEDLQTRDLVDPEPLERLIPQRQQELLSGAVALGSRLYAEKPKAFGKRVGAYWAIARG